MESKEKKSYQAVYAKQDCEVYCAICNKTLALKKGDEIPLCCGKVMTVMD